MRKPSNNPITLGFGVYGEAGYTQASPHKGTDFSYIPDNKIYAPFSGKVTLVPNNGNDGNGIYMTNTNGGFHGMLHSSQYLVGNGANVTEGQPIGVMGQTGLAYGVHLHWAVKQNGVFIDPMSLIKEDEMATEDDVEMLAHAFLNDSIKTNPGLKSYINQPLQSVINAFNGSPQRANYLKDQETVLSIANTRGDELNQLGGALGTGNIVDDASFQKALVAASGSTVLKPGKYQVN